MRHTLLAASVLLLSTQVASADPYKDRDAARDDRWAAFEHVRDLHNLDEVVSSAAYTYFTCANAAAEDAAHRDPLSPASWMTEWAANEAAKQCAAEGEALVTAAGKAQADATKAMVYRASVAAALLVRLPPDFIRLAPAGKK